MATARGKFSFNFQSFSFLLLALLPFFFLFEISMSKSHIRIPGGRSIFFFRFFRNQIAGQGFKFFLYSCYWDMKLYHGSFGFSKESLKFSIFFILFRSFILRDFIC